jgi:hypothetical protein
MNYAIVSVDVSFAGVYGSDLLFLLKLGQFHFQ